MFRDLKVYSQALGTAINYYHDNYGLGTDAVLHLDEGRNALIEFKLVSFEIEEGAKHLNAIVSLAKKIRNRNTMPEPITESSLDHHRRKNVLYQRRRRESHPDRLLKGLTRNRTNAVAFCPCQENNSFPHTSAV